MEKEFLTIKETARMLGVTPLTLRNWDKNGKFTASRHPINNYRVYRKAEVDMFIEDMKTKGWTTKNKDSQRDNEQVESRTNRQPKKLSVIHIED